MTLHIQSDRFEVQQGFEVSVQVPRPHTEPLLDAVYATQPLCYGDYDRVSFETGLGRQRFRSLPGGRIAATDDVVKVPCVELSFFVPEPGHLSRVLEALYAHHPYEEPVILIRPALRTFHRSGMDEDNPNKFWNRAPEDWVPEIHRAGTAKPMT